MNITQKDFNTRITQLTVELFGQESAMAFEKSHMPQHRIIKEIAIELFKRERSSKLIIDYLTELDATGKIQYLP
jgi:hypothetical protein